MRANNLLQFIQVLIQFLTGWFNIDLQSWMKVEKQSMIQDWRIKLNSTYTFFDRIYFRFLVLKVKLILILNLPSRHTLLTQHRFYVDSTPWLWIKVESMLSQRCVPAGLNPRHRNQKTQDINNPTQEKTERIPSTKTIQWLNTKPPQTMGATINNKSSSWSHRAGGVGMQMNSTGNKSSRFITYKIWIN